MEDLKPFFDAFKSSYEAENFVKITLSKPPKKTSELQNVYVRKVNVKNEYLLSFTYRYKTNDQFKNYSLDDAIEEITSLIDSSFKVATLFTLENDISVLKNKKGKVSIITKDPTFTNIPEIKHNKTKEKRVERAPYLFHLGITDKSGKVIPKMADKFRQINKYLEIVEGLIKQADLPHQINVVDMGSGKGYLTFALYDFLNNNLKLSANVVGIELRKELVDFCNDVAQKCDYQNLKFVSERIENYKESKIDVLIALHACDTATDDAIYKGLMSKSKLIICAPCCHKQVRKSVSKVGNNPILKHGIFQERQFEMVTDTLRALIMEKYQYKTKVFEFVSNEHTRKNIMLVGVKGSKTNKETSAQIVELLNDYHVNHYLNDLLK